MENVNDEPPHFEPPHQQVRVNEDSNEGVILHVIQAFDPDGGTLTFKFDSKVLFIPCLDYRDVLVIDIIKAYINYLHF